jgi:hypothetical protein
MPRPFVGAQWLWGNSMSGEMQFVAGTIIAILLAVPTFFGAKYLRSKRQNQKVGKSGRGYQAGGNINIKNEK